jgi:hypothetical protein
MPLNYAELLKNPIVIQGIIILVFLIAIIITFFIIRKLNKRDYIFFWTGKGLQIVRMFALNKDEFTYQGKTYLVNEKTNFMINKNMGAYYKKGTPVPLSMDFDSEDWNFLDSKTITAIANTKHAYIVATAGQDDSAKIIMICLIISAINLMISFYIAYKTYGIPAPVK